MPGEAGVGNSVRGRVEGTVVQAGYVGNLHMAAAPAPPRPESTLPVRPAPLVGRESETAALLALLDPAGPARAVALTGPAGVGKTALALNAAYEARARGWFPGQALYVDARAHRDDGISGVAGLLGALLRQLGLPGDQLDTHRAGLEGQLRGTLAAEPKSCLLVVDDLADPDHLVSLIPPDSRHRLLVTLRDRPAHDGVAELTLTGLPDKAARLLLAQLSGRSPEDELVAEVAGLCGRLPQALRVAAGRLAEHNDDVREFLTILRQPAERPAELGLVPLYDASLARLDPADARLLRLLTLHPGTETDTATAAALAGCPVPEAGRRLRRLCAAHLLEWAEGGPGVSSAPFGQRGRVRCHDLLWQYAKGSCQAVERAADIAAAEHRLLDHYVNGVNGTADATGATDDWLDREQGTLVLVVALAARLARYDAVTALVARLAPHLTGQARTVDALTVLGHAVTAAHRLGAHGREADLLAEMSRQYRGIHQEREATVCAEAGHLVRIRIGTLSPELDDALAEHAEAQHDQRAVVHHRARAARAWRRRGQGARFAASLSGLGRAWDKLDRPRQAMRAYTRAVAVAEAAGDPAAAARACRALADSVQIRDDHDRVTAHLTRGLELAQESGEVRLTVELLHRLAEARLAMRRPDAAEDLLATALRLADTHRLRLLRRAVLDTEARRLRTQAAAVSKGAEALEERAGAEVGAFVRRGLQTDHEGAEASDRPWWWADDKVDRRTEELRELAERTPQVLRKQRAAARLQAAERGLLERTRRTEEEIERDAPRDDQGPVPEPPAFRPDPHVPLVLTRLAALPGCALLWAGAWVVHGWLGGGRPVIWLAYLCLAAASAWAGRRVWRRSRGTRAGHVLALCVYRCHPAVGAALLAEAALTGTRVAAIGAALLLAAQAVLELGPELRTGVCRLLGAGRGART